MVEKVIRDPIHNYITINRQRERIILDLLGTREFQRLRRIRQLGVSQLTYPGATHCRFSHGLGVYHLARATLDGIANRTLVRIEPEIRSAALCLALLQDVGHGPYSHLLEDFFGGKHDEWTRRIILENTEVNRVLRGHSSELPATIVSLLEKSDKEHLWLSALLSGQLDVDRIDYLRRDSHYTGAEYGRFDDYRLLHSFELQEVGAILQPLWPMKACYAIEEYLFARYYMYQSVYFHRTTRGFEQVLRAIIQRASDLFKAPAVLGLECLPSMRAMFAGEGISTEDFLSLDDATIQAHLSHWRRCADPILADLCVRFCDRLRFTPIEVSSSVENLLDLASRLHEARAYLESKDCPSRFYLLTDSSGATVYDCYHPENAREESTPANSIYVVDETEGPKEISSVFPRIQNVTGSTKRSVAHHVYCHPEHAGYIKQILQGRPAPQ